MYPGKVVCSTVVSLEKAALGTDSVFFQTIHVSRTPLYGRVHGLSVSPFISRRAALEITELVSITLFLIT